MFLSSEIFSVRLLDCWIALLCRPNFILAVCGSLVLYLKGKKKILCFTKCEKQEEGAREMPQLVKCLS